MQYQISKCYATANILQFTIYQVTTHLLHIVLQILQKTIPFVEKKSIIKNTQKKTFFLQNQIIK